jgi:hypothetical protein
VLPQPLVASTSVANCLDSFANSSAVEFSLPLLSFLSRLAHHQVPKGSFICSQGQSGPPELERSFHQRYHEHRAPHFIDPSWTRSGNAGPLPPYDWGCPSTTTQPAGQRPQVEEDSRLEYVVESHNSHENDKSQGGVSSTGAQNCTSVQLFLLPKGCIPESSVSDTYDSTNAKTYEQCSSQDSHKTIQMHQDWLQCMLGTWEGLYPPRQ